jgi:hypothetical protein
MFCPQCGEMTDDLSTHVCYERLLSRQSLARDGEVYRAPLEDTDVLSGPNAEV